MDGFISSGTTSSSLRNLMDTDISASCGHSWNQSMQVQLMTAGNFLPRTRRVDPTEGKFKYELATTVQVKHVKGGLTWRETEYDFELSPDTVNKELPTIVLQK